ncbi:hypothetical protein ABT142_32780 [Streptomyces sp. NPDC001857]|uniref:hypothetical protein n=1 Tax=unclassified Streptomyces TaxID=2593676 RepID=UPI00332FC475
MVDIALAAVDVTATVFVMNDCARTTSTRTALNNRNWHDTLWFLLAPQTGAWRCKQRLALGTGTRELPAGPGRVEHPHGRV